MTEGNGRMTRFAVATLVTLAILLGIGPDAGAITVCTTTISDKRIDGDLVVPAGKTCDLEGVTVTGSVRVGQSAYFFAQYMSSGSTTIFGNFVAVDCSFVIWQPYVVVGQNVQITGCNGPSGSQLSKGTIGGNFTCNDDPGGCTISGSNVGGNAQVDNNGNFVQVRDNYIGGNLQCVGNPPSTLTVGKNTVAGSKQGQCAGATQ